jgi:hypothetical protein
MNIMWECWSNLLYYYQERGNDNYLSFQHFFPSHIIFCCPRLSQLD